MPRGGDVRVEVPDWMLVDERWPSDVQEAPLGSSFTSCLPAFGGGVEGEAGGEAERQEVDPSGASCVSTEPGRTTTLEPSSTGGHGVDEGNGTAAI